MNFNLNVFMKSTPPIVNVNTVAAVTQQLMHAEKKDDLDVVEIQKDFDIQEAMKSVKLFRRQPELLDLYNYIMTRHPPTWHDFFISAEDTVRFACERIHSETQISGKTILPRIKNVLAAFWLTPVPTIKCVIIGQDPYPGFTREGQAKAVGCCFSSRRDQVIPASLKVIYRELERSVEGWKNPGHPDLKKWGRQGVFLINTALTVEAGNAGSHVGSWRPFFAKLMDFVNKNTDGVVFMLWGGKAQSAAKKIYDSKHCKLEAYHPSPMAGNNGFSFSGNNHFNLANEYLVSKGKTPIDWNL